MDPQPHGSREVFVVDDDPEVGRALRRLLRSAGYEVESYGSAEEFLDDHPAPDGGVLVVDVRMPGMTGPELQRCLAGRGAAIPVLFISAVDDRRVREQVMAEGAAGWLCKPVDGDELLGQIGCLLSDEERLPS